MTRAEHIAWAKARALEYVDAGDVQQAFTSMASDLGKHHETAGHGALELGFKLLLSGLLTPAAAREWVEGIQ